MGHWNKHKASDETRVGILANKLNVLLVLRGIMFLCGGGCLGVAISISIGTADWVNCVGALDMVQTGVIIILLAAKVKY